MEESLSCHTCCDTGPRFFRSYPKDRPIQSLLTTHEDIYSNRIIMGTYMERSTLPVKGWNLRYMLGTPGFFSREGSLSCHTCCDMGPRFFSSHPKDAWGCREPILTPSLTGSLSWSSDWIISVSIYPAYQLSDSFTSLRNGKLQNGIAIMTII
jgi:hypothetical protein